MSNNWRTPKSEKMLEFETLWQKRCREFRAEHPDLSIDDATEMLLPEVMSMADEELNKEMAVYFIEAEIDATCFVFGHGADQQLIPDEELLRMSDAELAAWAQKNGVMFAQLKTHLAQRG